MIDGAAWSTVAVHAGAEVLAATGWLTLALLTFGRFMARGQRDGSLDYAS